MLKCICVIGHSEISTDDVIYCSNHMFILNLLPNFHAGGWSYSQQPSDHSLSQLFSICGDQNKYLNPKFDVFPTLTKGFYLFW